MHCFENRLKNPFGFILTELFLWNLHSDFGSPIREKCSLEF